MGHLLSPISFLSSIYLNNPSLESFTDHFNKKKHTTMSAAVAAAAAAACCSSKSSSTSRTHQTHHHTVLSVPSLSLPVIQFSRYEAQKIRDWNTFVQYLSHHCPQLSLARCSGTHVIEFLQYLDQFGKTKVHAQTCPFFGHAHAPAPCSCPMMQAWGSLDAMVGRLRVAFYENGGKPEMNPFATCAVRLYLRDVRDVQAKARGIGYERK